MTFPSHPFSSSLSLWRVQLSHPGLLIKTPAAGSERAGRSLWFYCLPLWHLMLWEQTGCLPHRNCCRQNTRSPKAFPGADPAPPALGLFRWPRLSRDKGAWRMTPNGAGAGRQRQGFMWKKSPLYTQISKNYSFGGSSKREIHERKIDFYLNGVFSSPFFGAWASIFWVPVLIDFKCDSPQSL